MDCCTRSRVSAGAYSVACSGDRAVWHKSGCPFSTAAGAVGIDSRIQPSTLRLTSNAAFRHAGDADRADGLTSRSRVTGTGSAPNQLPSPRIDRGAPRGVAVARRTRWCTVDGVAAMGFEQRKGGAADARDTRRGRQTVPRTTRRARGRRTVAMRVSCHFPSPDPIVVTDPVGRSVPMARSRSLVAWLKSPSARK